MNAWKYFIAWWYPASPASPGAAAGGGPAANALTESEGDELGDGDGSYLTFTE